MAILENLTSLHKVSKRKCVNFKHKMNCNEYRKNTQLSVSLVTNAEKTFASIVKNSYPTVLVANSQMNTHINHGTSEHTMTSIENGKNIPAASGQQLNHPL